ncbi:phosphoribosylaminoimidazolesuccinocarboxamide synthase [Macrococcoides goetzii]|uniref:phosphoribosylaminoimidazolesuccinocarboxamide synthase n=1 Tax=Macrococcus TaxID=69965 RepID=UPI001EF24865|nr:MULTISPECIES: phosphoribosylaminoimidazolesuccinocarboxamide synthase [Macrococcus]MCG7420242.1 phosphoribosylaminoimidazolesuccinocarboxamide synthase [Macrococcus epidermidis]MCH4985089.1 phosphoribosylaminoimidazolesuccinocarboxamide synthase [Macrococcus sp. PK]UTH17122.1 phosphoribosylaminoimidazolesuccinocarboxamide synthase [Macrococcus epidermidis]
MTLVYEGKAKRVFNTDDSNIYRIKYKDEVTAGNGAKKDKMEGKGRLNNLITSYFFERLAKEGVDSHFIERTSDTEQLVKKVTIIPLEVVVRNFAAGSIVKRLGFENGQAFEKPLVEFYYKEDALNDPFISDDHVKLLGLANDADIAELKRQALIVNETLIKIMDEMNLKLIDFKIEFGKDSDGNILLADEISPDTCRIWDKETNENFDKDVYRNDTGSLIETYTKFYNKLEAL